MADYRQEQPDREELEQPISEEQTSGPGTFLRRLGTLAVTLLIVLGVLAIALMGDGNYMDRFRRWLNYGSGAAEDLYAFAADEHNLYGQIDSYLVVLNQNYIQFLEEDGTAYQSVQVALSQPAMDIGGGLAAAYDVGGQNLFLVSPEEVVMELPLEEGYGYISARLNDKGWLAVTAERSGFKGGVSIYNREQELVYEIKISSQFVVDALVTEDCRSVLVVTYGQENGAFCTNLVRYDLGKQEPVHTDVLSDHLGFDLGQAGGNYISVSETELAFTAESGGTSGIYPFSGMYLQDYAFGEDFAAVLLSRYRSGSIGTLVTADGQGGAVAALDVSDEILDIDAAGDYLAVLHSNALILYTRDLQVYSRLENTGYASHVIMGKDGSALVIGGNSAWRYLP